MTDQQEFDSLIAGLLAKAERLFHWQSPAERAAWVRHVTEHAVSIRENVSMDKALEYLRA